MFNLDSALGINVRDDSLVIASVSKRIQGYALKASLVIEDYRELPAGELGSRIRQFADTNRLNREIIVVGIPRDQVVIREVDMPIEVEENLDQVVSAQIERLEPSDEVRSCFDYSVVRRDEDARRLTLRIYMARREKVEELVGLLEGLNLSPSSVRVVSAALGSLVTVRDEGIARNESALVVDLGEDKIQVLACSGDLQRFLTESYRWPGKEDYGVEWVVDRVADALAPSADTFPSFESVLLSGPRATSLLPEFQARIPEARLLRQGLGVTNKVHDPSQLEALLPAIGLAISGLQRNRQHNLLPPEKRTGGGRPNLVPTAVLAALLMVVLLALLTHTFYQQSVLADQISLQVEALEKDVSVVFSLREEVAEKRAEVEELRELLRGRTTTLAVLKDLTERIPDRAYLQSFQIQGDQITLQGYTDQASELLPLIQASLFLESVKTNWITKDPRMAGKDRFNFSAKVRTEP